ncbi:MAG TPA: hypothetical protein VMW40_05080 [Candidatus Bathyarchaeia archaeon]|nr:hypothetical protein [Candidatus Bathyarchaeia archaeon]
MTEDKFEKWCAVQDSKLKMYRVKKIIIAVVPVMLIPFMLVYAALILYFVSKFFTESIVFSFLIAGSFLIGLLMASSVKWLEGSSLNKVDYISCLLNKIAKEIELYEKLSDNRDLEHDIKALGKNTKFELDFPDPNLFKGDIEKQKKFYNLLGSLPSRLLYELEKGRIGEIKHRDIKDLGYRIWDDSDEKMDILEQITEDHPKVSEPKLNAISLSIRKILASNFSKLFLVTLLLIILSYFVLFRFIGLDKNTTAILFTAFFGVSAGIIFKRSS